MGNDVFYDICYSNLNYVIVYGHAYLQFVVDGRANLCLFCNYD